MHLVFGEITTSVSVRNLFGSSDHLSSEIKTCLAFQRKVTALFNTIVVNLFRSLSALLYTCKRKYFFFSENRRGEIFRSPVYSLPLSSFLYLWRWAPKCIACERWSFSHLNWSITFFFRALLIELKQPRTEETNFLKQENTSTLFSAILRLSACALLRKTLICLPSIKTELLPTNNW